MFNMYEYEEFFVLLFYMNRYTEHHTIPKFIKKWNLIKKILLQLSNISKFSFVRSTQVIKEKPSDLPVVKME